MTIVCKEFERYNNGYGPKIECPILQCGMMAAGLPWNDPIDFKTKLLRLKDALALVVLQRDQSEGRVSLSWLGTPEVSYELCDEDKSSMLLGLDGILKILVSSGADYLTTGHNNDFGIDLECEQATSCTADVLKSKKMGTYLDEVQKRGIEKHRTSVFSAHQMGSCRMGISDQDSVVNKNGEIW
eukprot:CAMPEP_0171319110 /NCGR_PEP_ID=MMETSP0816-20121228/93871_1 /TAXON_ID=420281 /ORGANISM="Proboscia inermis, Strain CCAP1064/1" /LENGTH=183 /DNA_ID=CAMNT_0011814407 /DNA_START=26 /DNA_END=574 /DNA_ORIENTATION=+